MSSYVNQSSVGECNIIATQSCQCYCQSQLVPINNARPVGENLPSTPTAAWSIFISASRHLLTANLLNTEIMMMKLLAQAVGVPVGRHSGG